MANDDSRFSDAVHGLIRGDFSRLDPLFAGEPCQIVQWYEAGCFAEEPETLSEALSCACFNGRTTAAEFLLDKGVDPSSGKSTGLNAFHWAANRGQLETVRLLLVRHAPLEERSIYG